MPRPRPGEGRENVTPEDVRRARRLVEIHGSVQRARMALGVSDTTFGCILDGWRVSGPRLAEIRIRMTELGV